MLVVGQEQLDSPNCVSEPPDRVEPWRENESDATGGDGPFSQAGCANERAQTDIRRLVEHLQTISCEDPVFAAQWRDVGDRREGDEVEHAVDGVLVAVPLSYERKRELERDADRGEIAIRRRAARAFRVQHGEGRREDATARQVVIGDDHVDAGVLQRSYGLVCAGATVAGNDHAHACS